MHPELFTIGNFTVHTYGFMIMIGAILGFLYFTISVKKDLGIEREPVQNLAILVILSAVIGGKVF
ncbi:MAG: prolipoprotein diacylglyceryl transferase family protein, partial [Bacteroidota bacterium]